MSDASAIYISIDTRLSGGFTKPRVWELIVDVVCPSCHGLGEGALCTDCSGSGVVVKHNELTLPALDAQPLGYWLAYPGAGPSIGVNPPADVVFVVVARLGSYDLTVPAAPELLERGGTVVAKVTIPSTCLMCRGLSRFELPTGAVVYEGEYVTIGDRITCTVRRNFSEHVRWCDGCFSSGEVEAEVDIQVPIPPGISPEHPIHSRLYSSADNIAADHIVAGDFCVKFDLEAKRATDQAQGQAQGPTAVKTVKTIIAPSIGDVVLAPEVEKHLLRALAMFEANDPAAPRGLLLTGPPGTGKTLLAKSISEATKCQFYPTSLADLKGAYVGHSAKKVNELWEKATAASRAIIFIDECEGAFPRRGSESSDDLTNELVQTFLAAWDGFTSKNTVWVIGATNRPDIIDEAIVSRFGETIPLGLPGPELRARILRREFKAMRVPLRVTDELVENTVGLSGRDLATLARSVRQETFPDPPTVETLTTVINRLRKRTSTMVDAAATWDTLILEGGLKQRLIAMAKMLKESQKLRNQSFEPPSTMLLEGPPGTGKTQIARTLANESKLNFISATMAELKAGYVGQSGGRVKDLFGRARFNSPCILFLDELDAIAPDRNSGNADSAQAEMVGQLLQELDGIKESNGNILVIGATNRADDVDEAIRSRFFMRTIIPLPTPEQRARILEVNLGKHPCTFPIPEAARVLAEQLEGRSGRDLKNLVDLAAQRAVSRAFSAGDGLAIALERNDLDEALAVEHKERSTTVDPTATWQRLVLDDATKDQLRTVSVMLQSAEELERSRLEVPSALLLEGPPGTGKTQIARTLANESGLKFIGVQTADIKAGYLGQSGERIRRLFHDARVKSPCIVFIDEIDVVAGRRGTEDRIMTEMVGQLLQELDGVQHSPSHVFVVAATNRPADLDAGILSRFPWRIRIGLPDVDQRRRLLDLLIGPVSVDFERADVYQDLAASLDGASGRDLKNIVEVAERRAMTRMLNGNGPRTITLETSDLKEAAASAGFSFL